MGCAEFPFVVLTSNDEREFPMAFLPPVHPAGHQTGGGEAIGRHHRVPPGPGSGPGTEAGRKAMITKFLDRQRTRGTLANDQLLNAVLMAERGLDGDEGLQLIHKDLLRALDEG